MAALALANGSGFRLMEAQESRGGAPPTGEDVDRERAPAPGRERVRPRLAIVVPCFNEELVVNQTAHRLAGILHDLKEKEQIAPESFLYFVDDGSTDRTWNLLCRLNHADGRIKALKLARNFGHQNALLAGLLAVKDQADCVISMDADLQHDEAAIYSFLDKYRQGADIVYGVRCNPGTDSRLKRLTSASFYWLMRSMGSNVLRDHPDYRLVSARVLDVLAGYREVNLFLRGIFSQIGFRSEVVPFDARERAAGVSHYSWPKMIGFALDGITSFSVVPLRIIAIAGAFIMFMALLLVAYIVVSALRGSVVPGWASTVLPIYVLGGFQIMITGLVAEYVGKIYSEVKQRPRFIKEQELP